jgi:response regulator of citrate/malate metabolism
MKIVLVSNDNDVINTLDKIDIVKNSQVLNISSPSDSCEILSEIVANNPSLIIFDNDFIENDTVKILKSLRKIDSKVSIILVTSELSIELGRELSQIGIHFKALKPISKLSIEESIQSLQKSIYH